MFVHVYGAILILGDIELLQRYMILRSGSQVMQVSQYHIRLLRKSQAQKKGAKVIGMQKSRTNAANKDKDKDDTYVCCNLMAIFCND